MKKLTLDEIREEIDKRDLWVWRQNKWGTGLNATGGERSFEDYDYPGPGLEAGFWDIPNM